MTVAAAAGNNRQTNQDGAADVVEAYSSQQPMTRLAWNRYQVATISRNRVQVQKEEATRL
jgi:hypothetical protein